MIEAASGAVWWCCIGLIFNPESAQDLDQISNTAPIFQKVFCALGNGVGSLKKLGHARTRGGKI